MKNLINKIKEEIKSQAVEQRFIKSQRKTEHLVGERKISSYDAAEKARNNKHQLAIKYVAYYILKHGLEEPVIEINPRNPYFTHCANLEAVENAIKKCCGDNCYLLDYTHRTAYDISKTIEEWKKKYQEEEKQRRLYVLIDKDLDSVYGCVQGGHAVAEYLLEHPNGWKNEYLVYLKADVEKWYDKLKYLGLDFSIFKEPDLGNKMTAIAIENDGRLFRNLKLIK